MAVLPFRCRRSCQPAVLAAVFLSLFSLLSQAATVESDFHVGWVYANPDGAFTRPVVGVNGEWPLPLIRATVGDELVLNVFNELGNASTSIHFHGFFQNGTNYMDGAVGVTQCGIPPGESFTYNIKFEQPGTYWYHAHNNGQYIDGLRGTVVVQDPQGPFEGQYDEEIVFSLSDWYHQLSPNLLQELINVENPTGAEPVPQAALINDTQNLQVSVEPGKTYLVRIANIGGFASHYLWFEGHSMSVIEVDGVWTQPAEAEMLYITPAQRYSVLLKTRDDASANFAIVSAMDEELFDVIPDDQNSNVTAWLVYNAAEPLPEPTPVDDLDAFDDMDLVPFDAQGLLENVDISITLDVKMDNLRDGANYAFFNDKTYREPKVPSLYSALSVGADNVANPRVYGTYTLPQVLRHGAVVEVVLNNGDDGTHPFHLHGHNFQVIYRSEDDAGDYDADEHDASTLPSTPMRRDTVYVRPNGNFAIRFRADNPGVWLFHCHIEWHMDQGLIATFIEAPEAMQDMTIPADHLRACRAAGALTAGNAAGNVRDVLDLTGENRPPPSLPEGFTAKGYVALFFSTVAAIIGMAIITWYGMLDTEAKETSTESQPLISEEDDAEADI